MKLSKRSKILLSIVITIISMLSCSNNSNSDLYTVDNSESDSSELKNKSDIIMPDEINSIIANLYTEKVESKEEVASRASEVEAQNTLSESKSQVQEDANTHENISSDITTQTYSQDILQTYGPESEKNESMSQKKQIIDNKDSVCNTVVKLDVVVDQSEEALHFKNYNYYDPNENRNITGYFSTGNAGDLLNNYRLSNNLNILEKDEQLNNLAKARAIEISASGCFSHDRPDGNSILTVSYCNGENIAMGTGNFDAEAAFNGWKNSQGHNENMLRDSFKKYGVAGFTTTDGATYWVQVFGN